MKEADKVLEGENEKEEGLVKEEEYKGRDIKGCGVGCITICAIFSDQSTFQSALQNFNMKSGVLLTLPFWNVSK